MKVDKNYRMSKPLKTYLNCLKLNTDSETYTSHKQLFTEAENHSDHSRKKMSVKITDVETDDA